MINLNLYLVEFVFYSFEVVVRGEGGREGVGVFFILDSEVCFYCFYIVNIVGDSGEVGGEEWICRNKRMK